ncbi:MAG: cytochrome c [Gammaproteobacteria bacterium]|nr:MAG: cytochrome c [Gammaproteobacteria bacterium]
MSRRDERARAIGWSAAAHGAAALTALAVFAALAVPSAARAADSPAPPAYPRGFASFQGNCAVCHGPAGAGVPALAPPLLSYPARYAGSTEGRRQLALTVLYGMIGDITVDDKHYNFQMPEFSRLDDAQLAATLNFIVFDLGHAPADVRPVSEAEIAAERARAMDGAAVREHRTSVAPTVSP